MKDTRERLASSRKSRDVTSNGVAFEWWLASSAGAGFLLFREPHHTDADIEEAKRLLHSDRDVVGKIQVEEVGIAHVPAADEHVFIAAMGKNFRIRQITTSDDDANAFMEANPDTALIAVFGPFKIVANKHEGIADATPQPEPGHFRVYTRMDDAVREAKPEHYIVAFENSALGGVTYATTTDPASLGERKNPVTVMRKPLQPDPVTEPEAYYRATRTPEQAEVDRAAARATTKSILG